MSEEQPKSNEDGDIYPLPIEDAENEDHVFLEIDTQSTAEEINKEPYIQN